MMNVIEAACEPVKADAMTRAEEVAREMVSRAAAELEKAGNDLQVAAPYPSGGLGRAEYMTALARYRFFGSITTARQGSRRMHDPNYADITPDRVERFVLAAREDAAFQYEAFVAKLNTKIGECTVARLEGNHVWSYSFLHVTTVSGEQQVWKTQMIINMSKLGKLFNQFPTRKVKA